MLGNNTQSFKHKLDQILRIAIFSLCNLFMIYGTILLSLILTITSGCYSRPRSIRLAGSGGRAIQYVAINAGVVDHTINRGIGTDCEAQDLIRHLAISHRTVDHCNDEHIQVVMN